MAELSARSRELEFHHGIARWYGKPAFLISADYPYFRDDPANWLNRLEEIRGLGIRLITSYVPWRHHEVELEGTRRFDFRGQTDPRRDVIAFIDGCRWLDLRLILKPGPFCHAELNYGGLPDFVCPLRRPDIPPVLAADGTSVGWPGAEHPAEGALVHWPLPSALSPVFMKEVATWLTAFRDQVLLPAASPNGPVVAVQVGNEGIFSDAQHAVWSHDYSAPAIQAFRQWLRRRYPNLAAYNTSHGTSWKSWDDIDAPRRWSPPTDPCGILGYRDWSEFLGFATGQLYAAYAQLLGSVVPALANVNPPRGESWGIDAWLSRVQPRTWNGVHYGYTNWIGIASRDPAVIARYAVTARLMPGPNLEENWGFTEYGAAYAHPIVCFQQTLLMIAAGATGYNIYTGAGTAGWSEDLDSRHARPYPSHAPIGPQGEPSNKVAVVRLLGEFFGRYGTEFLACRSIAKAAWAMYRPQSYLGAWIGPDGAEARVNGQVMTAPGPLLAAAYEALMAAGHDLDLVDLQTASLEEARRYQLLLLPGESGLDEDTWALLDEYLNAGGKLLVVGAEPPTERSRLRLQRSPWARGVLRLPDRSVAGLRGIGDLLQSLGVEPVTMEPKGAGLAWLRVHPTEDIHYVMAISWTAASLRIRYSAHGRRHDLSLQLAPGGGAVVRVVSGKPTAILVKVTIGKR
jgi:beta-galactosidase